VKTPVIDRVLPMSKTPIIDDILATHEQGFVFRGPMDMPRLATELRAVLAERERLAGEVTEWEGHAQTYEAGMVAAQRELAALRTPAPPRRLREYKGVTYRDGKWDNGVWWCANVHNALAKMFDDPTEKDYLWLLDLQANPYAPVETLEEVVEKWYWSTPFASLPGSAREDLCTRIRAHLATQPNTPSGAKNVGAALEYSTQPQAITPEQAVAVLVEKGAEVFYNDCRDTVFGQSRVKQGVYIVILPKGVTP
jgi:hypothetical protein